MKTYYKAIYTRDKIQKKKKKFEDGFAVFDTGAKRTELFDDSGKLLGKVNSAAITDDADRGVEYVFVGGFYVELDYEIKEDEFVKGKCFMAPVELPKLELKMVRKPGQQNVLQAKKTFQSLLAPTIKQAPDNKIFLNEIDIERGFVKQCFIEPFLAEKLREHQKEGIKYLFDCVTGLRDPLALGCILGDSMGLGKTVQVISLIWVLAKQSPFEVDPLLSNLNKFPADGESNKPMIQCPVHISEMDSKSKSDLNSKDSKLNVDLQNDSKKGNPATTSSILDPSRNGLARKICIIAPLTLVYNWKREFAKWLGGMRINPVIATNNGDQSLLIGTVKRYLKDQNRVIILSYEALSLCFSLLKDKIDLLICDEAQRLKNLNTKLFSTLNSFKTKRRILITGTPLQNSLGELFASLNFIAPLLFDDETRFKKIFFDPIAKGMLKAATDYERHIGNERAKELIGTIQPLILRRGEEILRKVLPKKREFIVFLKMTESQQQLYLNYLNELNKQYNVNTNKISEVFGVLSRFRKLLAHPLLFNAIADFDFKEKKPKKKKREYDYELLDDTSNTNVPLGNQGGEADEDSSFSGAYKIEDSFKFEFIFRILYKMGYRTWVNLLFLGKAFLKP